MSQNISSFTASLEKSASKILLVDHKADGASKKFTKLTFGMVTFGLITLVGVIETVVFGILFLATKPVENVLKNSFYAKLTLSAEATASAFTKIFTNFQEPRIDREIELS